MPSLSKVLRCNSIQLLCYLRKRLVQIQRFHTDPVPAQLVDVALSNAAVKGEEIPQAEQISIPDAMDVMIRWFCLLFGNQFTPDDVLDGYPVDRLMHDIALALMAVQTQTTEILSEFPTKAAKEPASPPKTAEAEEIPLF